MDWSQFDMDRLYELYQQHFDRLREDVIEVNRSMGSSSPEKTWMDLLSRIEFEQHITAQIDEPEIIHRWIRRIIRGYEHEFPALLVA